MNALDTLKRFGASKKDILAFDTEEYSKLDYLELINQEYKEDPRLTGVICSNRDPILYYISADALSTDPIKQNHETRRLRQIISCRGNKSLLAIVKPGLLTIYACYFAEELPDGIQFTLEDNNSLLIRDLLHGATPEKLQSLKNKGRSSKSLQDLLFGLMDAVTDELFLNDYLSAHDDDILSLVGRALFTRFLIDRKIINKKTFPKLYKSCSPEECFNTPELAALTCEWLDKIFNGDLLPIIGNGKEKSYTAYFKKVHNKNKLTLGVLSRILYKTSPSGQLYLDFGIIDFAYVPVGLLSQVYEKYAHKNFGSNAQNESIYYTPFHVANFMVDEAFKGIKTCKKHEAKILDPTVGAGVFIVLCFKKLVEEHWKENKKRPDSQEIRKILVNQIRGFDINNYALKLSALSLYLTAIELDPNPFPPEKLKFDKLIDKVLIPTRGENEAFPKYPVLGSLGPMVSDEHLSEYDLIIGNPPWTKWENEEGNSLNKIIINDIKQIAGKRSKNFQDIAENYYNDQNFTDTPFIWKSMIWAKPKGIIALAIHGRFLFRSAKASYSPLKAIFRSLKVTGILNGAALRQTRYWQNMSQAFCLLFAENIIPKKNDEFFYISPYRETSLNNENRITIDFKDANAVSFDMVYKNNYLFKTLFRGAAADFEVVSRLNKLLDSDNENPKAYTLKNYWKEILKLDGGEGYQVEGKDKNKNPADELLALKGVDLRYDDVGAIINISDLEPFSHKFMHRTRRPGIYKGPLVLLKHTLGSHRKDIRAKLSLSNTPVIYYERFYGFSCAKYSNPEELARYLFAIFNSEVFLYYILMTNPKYGVEREQAYITDIYDFPIIPIYRIHKSKLKKLSRVICSYNKNEMLVDSINDWVYDIYDISSTEKQIISDTLDTNLPYAESIKKAENRPDDNDINIFCNYLEKELNKFTSLIGMNVSVSIYETDMNSWEFIVISNKMNIDKKTINIDNILKKMTSGLASRNGSSQISFIYDKENIIIGMLAEYRYWTKTRARQKVTELLMLLEKQIN